VESGSAPAGVDQLDARLALAGRRQAAGFVITIAGNAIPSSRNASLGGFGAIALVCAALFVFVWDTSQRWRPRESVHEEIGVVSPTLFARPALGIDRHRPHPLRPARRARAIRGNAIGPEYFARSWPSALVPSIV